MSKTAIAFITILVLTLIIIGAYFVVNPPQLDSTPTIKTTYSTFNTANTTS